MRRRRDLALAVVVTLVAAESAMADTLHLRNGRRIDGELVAARGDVIEFRERGWRGSVRQYDRRDVRAIELDEAAPTDDRRGDSRTGDDERPGGMREREVVVSGDIAWNDTGIDVRPGQVVYFSAVGRVQWGPGRRDGPAGEENSPYNANRPMARRPAAALIGRVGEGSTDYFFIGDEKGPVRVRSGGRLFLGVNDDYLQDNRGNFRVVVSY